MKQVCKLSLVAVVAFSLSLSAFAQPGGAASTSARGPGRPMQNIVFSGLAGAILGLSTLSFYGRPQDRLSNIAVGFAIGVIGGTIYTTYKAASAPRDFYGLRESGPHAELWQLADIKAPNPDGYTPLNYQFDF